MQLRKLVSYLTPADFVSLMFLFFLTSLNFIFFARVPVASTLITINLIVSACIFYIAYRSEQTPSKLWGAAHRWYYYPFIIFVFKELYFMVRPIHPIDYDELFITIDRWMFGVDPTVWMSQFANPVLTEILQIAYFSYYLLFIMLGIELYKRYDVKEFDKAAFFIVYGFYLSYVGYFLLPAVGPRFTLHDFYAINTELPGLLLTPWMRDFINAGESVSFSMPDAIEHVQRDVFPSGHTQLTLVVVYLSFFYKIKLRWVIAILSTLLIIATVYLRYHYVIDLIGGFMFFLITIWTGKKMQQWWSEKQIELRKQNS